MLIFNFYVLIICIILKVLWVPNNKFYVYLDYVQDSNCYRYPPVLIVMTVQKDWCRIYSSWIGIS